MVLTELGLLRTSPGVEDMSDIDWALAAKALDQKRTRDRTFEIDVAKQSIEALRTVLIELLGLNIESRPGAAPRDNFVPLVLYTGNPETWSSTKQTLARIPLVDAALSKVADTAVDAFVGDMEPDALDFASDEAALGPEPDAWSPAGSPQSREDEAKSLGIELSDEPFSEFDF